MTRWQDRIAAETPEQADRRRELQRAANGRYRIAHPDRVKAIGARWYAERGGAETTRAINLKRWYGISIEEYDRLFELQGGLCAICRKPETRKLRDGTSPLSVDHDHETKAVRGLLCSRCNTALGMLQDDPALLAAAIAYLRKRG